MSTFRHSYSDLKKSTGLDQNFIRRIMRDVPELKARHTENGSSGELLFDDNAVIVLQQAAQMRANKRPFKLISKAVFDAVTPLQNVNADIKQDNTSQQENIVKEMLSEIKRSHDVALKAQQETIDQLKQRILLLTDGRDPAEVRRERELEQARLLQLEREKAEAELMAKQARSEAENAADTARDLMQKAKAEQEALELARAEAEQRARDAQSKADEQLHELAKQEKTFKDMMYMAKTDQETQKKEIKKLLADNQERVSAARERVKKREELLDQLDQLSWFQWNRKRELLKQIRELDKWRSIKPAEQGR